MKQAHVERAIQRISNNAHHTIEQSNQIHLTNLARAEGMRAAVRELEQALQMQMDDDQKKVPGPDEDGDDPIQEAWTIIANASGGDWHKQSDEWSLEAARWRDKYIKKDKKEETQP